MKRIISTNIRHDFNQLICTLFVVLGFLGLLVPASYAAKPVTTVSPVSNLVAKAVSQSQVGLTWTYTAASKISGYSIERSLSSSSSFQVIATAAPLDISLADAPLADGKSYYYRMRAFTKSGKTTTYSSYSPIATATTPTAVTADTTAPTVSISSPANATTYISAQTVTIAANASDNVGVSRVEFYNGATLLKNDTTSPYFVDWAISSANNGSHNLSAKAYDAAGNSTVSTVAVTVNIPLQDLSAPTVSLTSPAAGTTFTSAQTVRIAASATSTTGISKVDLYDGATLLKNDTTSPYFFDWVITSAHNGSHNLTAKVYDAAGNSTVSSAVAVTVNIPVQDLSLPTVSLTSPVAGATFTSAQTVRIAAATSSTGVSKVDLYDGATLLKNDTTSPYYFDWQITSADNGSHSLTAKVYDTAGNSTVSAAVVINVKIETTIVSTETVFYGYDKNAGANDDPYAAPYGGITRYVDPGKGVNSGNGSITSPWKDLQYALTHATAGDSIYLRGGVHNYGITISGNVAATQLKPVEVRSYPGEWAIIDGSNIANGNLVRLFNESWIIFRNFEIRYSDKTKVSNGIYAENLTDCEFHNIYMHNNNGAGFSAKELYRVKFFNCSAIDNVDIQTSGDSADGFSVTSGDSNKFYRCVATGNSDDGYDFWAASKHYLEDCVSATNGSGTGGDGNGFKLGKPDPAPYEGLRGGYHTLVRCISLKNKFRGYSENATTNGSTLTGCIAYNSGQNWELPNAAHKVTNGISFDGNGDKIGSATTVTASEGQGFGGTVYVSDFESVNIADMNNQTAGQRFFYAVRNLF